MRVGGRPQGSHPVALAHKNSVAIPAGVSFDLAHCVLNQLASAESIVSVDPPVGQPPGDLSFSLPAGTLCELAWPSNLIGAILETTTDVGGSVPWTTVSTATNAITTTDTERIYFDPVTPGEPKRVFRLRRAH